MQTGWDEGEMKAMEKRGKGGRWQTRDSVCMHMYVGGGGEMEECVCFVSMCVREPGSAAGV